MSWIKPKQPDLSYYKYENKLIKPGIIEKLVKSSDQHMGTMIMVLWESGSRWSEFINLRVGDVQIKRNCAEVTFIIFKRKKVQKTLSLIYSRPFLIEFLKNHPYRFDQDAPLWYSKRKNKHNEYKLSYPTFVNRLKKLKEKLGITEPLNPHHFRHSRNRNMESKMSIGDRCYWFGWKKGSPMLQRYGSGDGENTRRTYLSINGVEEVKQELEKEIESLKPVKCPICNHQNQVSSPFCLNCYNPLQQQSLRELSDIRNLIQNIVSDILLLQPNIRKELPNLVQSWKVNNQVRVE